MTPGEFKKQGVGLQVSYGFHHTPFGECLAAVTERGICHLGFVEGGKQAEAIKRLCDQWPEANFTERPESVSPTVERLFGAGQTKDSRPFNLCLKGTNFQISVWKALVNIPGGCLVCYQDIASHIGPPKAFRAVANAVAINPIAFLIPCHRVITSSGRLHQYRWGSVRKKAIIGWEAASTG
jgi:AraC family transcriptional regulator of adaptative response/methylated-DNA-[protein]-cysteine methyltransferase